MDEITEQELEHYRTHMKIYGTFITLAADDTDFVKQLIRGEDQGSLMSGLRERIEVSPRYS